MNKILKTSILFIFLASLNLSCSSDDDDRPLCSEINIFDPGDNFVPCEDPESICQCG